VAMALTVRQAGNAPIVSENTTPTEDQRMERRPQQIRLSEIESPDGQRALGHLDALMASIQEVGLLQPIVVTGEAPHYRLIAGWRRYHACKRLDWPEIPATIVAVDELHAELAAIDENLIRQELTVLERAEQFCRRKEIYEALHPETKHGNGPGRGYREKKRNKFASFAADAAAKTGRDKRTVQYEVQIGTKLSAGVKESIRSLPSANKITELLQLAREPQERQEAIVGQLVSGGAKSVREARRALKAGAADLESTPSTRRSPRVQTSDPQPTSIEPNGEDRGTLLHTIVAHFQQSSAIADAQVAGRPAAGVMAERLAALPSPELVLLRALMVGQVHEAAASWVAAVRAEVQHGVHPFEDVKPPVGHGDSADTPNAQPTLGDEQAQRLALPDVVTHSTTEETTCGGGQRRSTAVNAGLLPDEDSAAHAADPDRSTSISATVDTADAASVDLTRCGWCGGTQFRFISEESGRVYCPCGSIYRPSTGRWDPGDRDKRQRPLVSVPAPGGMRQDQIERGPSDATASSDAGGRAVMEDQEGHHGVRRGSSDRSHRRRTPEAACRTS
jgi:ParB family transcriptional regulator, chromosome partitioning protein